MTDLQNWAPYSVLAGPADVYLGPSGEAFPAVDEAPAGGWKYIGETEGGVTARHTQTVTTLTSDQHTGGIKAVRTEEGEEVEFSIVNMTLENYALVLNGVPVTSQAGPPATKTIKLHRGVHVDLRSLLLRGRSPYGNLPAQYQVPVVFQNESPEVAHVKDDKQVLHCVWVALEDLSAASDDDRFGQLIAQTS